MKRLRRKGVRAPADWNTTVDAAFPDPKAFWKAARAFEGLALHGKKRKLGFAAYAPGVLVLNSKGDPDFPPVWRRVERVRQLIADMSHGFCAYCQSPVSSNHPGKDGEKKPPGHIEHLLPKSRFPTRAYRLANYFLGCMNCNTSKGDKWPPGGYVRPDRGDPGARFVFHRDGSVSARRKGDTWAQNTVTDLDLDRAWLKRHRSGAIEAHLDIVGLLIGRPGIALDDLLVTRPVAFSEAINQNVRRLWAMAKKKKGKP